MVEDLPTMKRGSLRLMGQQNIRIVNNYTGTKNHHVYVKKSKKIETKRFGERRRGSRTRANDL